MAPHPDATTPTAADYEFSEEELEALETTLADHRRNVAARRRANRQAKRCDDPTEPFIDLEDYDEDDYLDEDVETPAFSAHSVRFLVPRPERTTASGTVIRGRMEEMGPRFAEAQMLDMAIGVLLQPFRDLPSGVEVLPTDDFDAATALYDLSREWVGMICRHLGIERSSLQSLVAYRGGSYSWGSYDLISALDELRAQASLEAEEQSRDEDDNDDLRVKPPKARGYTTGRPGVKPAVQKKPTRRLRIRRPDDEL